MRRSTTSAGTERLLLGLLLAAELIGAGVLAVRPAAVAPSPPAVAAARLQPANPPEVALAASRTLTLPDGRGLQLLGLGGADTAPLLDRVAAEAGAAADAVTTFWGADWPHDIVVVATGTDEQFRALAVGGPDIAAATTDRGIVFAPGAAAMSADALRIVVRHELFHFATRPVTAADAPRWLTEGVADFVARPQLPPPAGADLARFPTDAELDTAGPTRSLAYDRAWWFSRFVAERYGTAALRALYLRACGPGHADLATALRDTLGQGLDEVTTRWRQWAAR